MRRLASILTALAATRNSHSPQSPGGFGLRLPSLPSAPLPAGAARAGVPVGIDASGQPVTLPRGESVLIAGDPRTHVLTALRALAIGHARYPGTRLHVYEPDVLGDLSALRGLAHRYVDTTSGGATIAAATGDLRDLADLIRRRGRQLDDINTELAAAEARIRRVTGTGAPRLTSLTDLHAVKQTVWEVAGINPDRIDPETADLHPHIVVIGHAIRWVLTDDDGPAFTTMLTRVAHRGQHLGVSVLLGSDAAYLPYLPADLTPAFRHRLAMGLAKPEHADQVLGALARQSGIDAAPARLRSPGQGWYADLVPATVPAYRRVQVYDANPHAFRYECVRLTRARRKAGWLTGDAADQGRGDTQGRRWPR